MLMSWPAVVVAVVAICAWPLLSVLPFPYEAITVKDLLDDRFDRLVQVPTCSIEGHY